jgi:hypothetical protein
METVQNRTSQRLSTNRASFASGAVVGIVERLHVHRWRRRKHRLRIWKETMTTTNLSPALGCLSRKTKSLNLAGQDNMDARKPDVALISADFENGANRTAGSIQAAASFFSDLSASSLR